MNREMQAGTETGNGLGGETPVIPGEDEVLPAPAKLPNPSDLVRDPELRAVLDKAWVDYMARGFEHTDQMFQQTLKAYMRPYYITVAMYVALFAVGVGFFIAAIVAGLLTERTVVAVGFGGLSVVSFLLFFIRMPLQALEENLEFITWLGVAFNTYWTRLMYLDDRATIQIELKNAADDYVAMVERLIKKHAEMRRGRPGPAPSGADPGAG